MDRKVFSDYSDIKETGISNWANAFTWPIIAGDNKLLQTIIKDVFNEFIKKNTLISTPLLINYKFYIPVYKKLFELLLIESLLASNYIIKIKDNSHTIFNIYRNNKFSNEPTTGLKTKSWVRSNFIPFYVSLKSNKFKIPFFLDDPVHILLQSHSDLTIEFIKKQNYLNVKTLDVKIKTIDAISSYRRAALLEEIRNMIDCLNSRIAVLKISMNQEQKTSLSDDMLKMFIITDCILNGLNQNYPIHKIQSLFIASNNNIFSRSLSSIITKRGGEVFGFHHGHPFVIESDLVSWLELSLCTHFIHYTNRMASIQQETFTRFPAVNDNVPKFIGSNTKHFDRLYSNNLNISFKRNKPAKILLAGVAYPRNTTINIDFPYFHECLYLEYSILSYLRDLQYDIYYKKHPEGFFFNKGNPFESIVKTIDGDFNEILKDFDCVIFHTFRSSAFSYALVNRVPIIYIKNTYDEINPMLMDTIKANCAIIDSYYDEFNRIQISRDQLIGALQSLESYKPHIYYHEFLTSNKNR